MPTFDYTFTVNAPQDAVLAFHQDTRVLKILTPPPLYAQIHSYEPLAEGAEANFTLWFGPYPIRWTAVHSNVGEDGFTDTQVRGPLKRWQHTHRFSPLSEEVTLVSEHIDYEYHRGVRGLIGRLLFSPLALTLLFTARKVITRRRLAQAQKRGRQRARSSLL